MRDGQDRGEECRGFVPEQVRHASSPAAASIPTSLVPRTAKQHRKGTVLPYSLLSVGAGADPGVQAVSLQVM